MIKVVALIHPFRSDRIIKEIEGKKCIEEIYNDLNPILDIDHVRIILDDKPVTDFSVVPVDGQTVIIRVVPGNGGDTGISDQEAGKGALGSLGLMIAGGLLSVLSGGLLASVGVGMIYAGGAGFLSAIGVIAVNHIAPLFGSSGNNNSKLNSSDVLPQVRGSRNIANPWGVIPVVLGRHLVIPPLASTPYTEIVGNDQYLRQLFCLGYSELELSEFKIGDTPVSKFSGVITEIRQDGTLSGIVPYQVVENNIGQELKYNDPVVRTTAEKCTEISLDLTFPSGLVKYDDNGNKTNTTVAIATYYKPAGSSEANYQALSSTTSWTDNTSTTKRITLSKAVSEGQYDVKVVRTTADATEGKIVDKSYWGALRAKRNKESVSPSMRSKICTVGLKIKASNQLSGSVDRFNCIAQSKVPTYSGSGSGAGQWTTSTLTSNPAALFLWVLRGTPNPRPVDDSKIDWASLETWYNWCESTGHECNAVVTAALPLKDLLQKICSTGRASYTKVDEKYTIIQDVERSTPIQHFTPRNSWGFVGSKAFPDIPHALKMSFINKDAGYAPDERIVYDDGYDENNASKFQSIKVWGITDPDQIWKDTRYQIACSRLRPELYSINCDVEYLVCTRGDLVRVTHDVPLFGLHVGRIKSITADGNGDITEIEVDETFVMEAGKDYGIRIRTSDGTSIYRGVSTVEGENNNLILSTTIPASDGPASGDLVMFGESSQESVEMIVIAVEPQKDLTAKITMVEYNPACYTADSGMIPAYDSKITLPGDWQDSNLIHEIYNQESTLNENINTTAMTTGSTPSYADLDEGYTSSSGGTTVPTQPTISTFHPVFKGFILQWDRQTNLTNFDKYQIQVSDDGTAWYSLGFDGTGWQGSLNQYTDWYSEFLVHSDIPFTGSDDDPTGQTLYYRVRRVTKAAVSSAWNTTAAKTTLTIQSGELAKDSVFANNLKAGILQAQFIDVSQDLTIGYVGTGTIDNPNEGDRRVYIDGDEISFVEYTNGLWSTINSIKLGGADSNGNFAPFLQCRGVVNPLGDPINTEFFPKDNFRVFNFEGNTQDQNGLDNWDAKTNVAFDSSIKKFGNSSWKSSTGASLLRATEPWTVGASQAAGAWVYFSAFGATPRHTILGYFTSGYDEMDIIIDNDLKIKLHFVVGTSQNGYITSPVSIELGQWYYVGLVYRADLVPSTPYLIVNDTITPGSVTSPWDNSPDPIIFAQVENPNNNGCTALSYIDELIFAPDTTIDPQLFVQHYTHNVPWNTDATAKDLMLKPDNGGKVLIDGGISIKGVKSNVLSYQKDTTTRNFSTTWADGWVTDIFTVPAGSTIKTDFTIAARNNSTSWGGGYTEVLYEINQDGNWLSLGISGYDTSVMENGGASIATYNNNFIQDFSNRGEKFTLRYKFRHKSYDGTLTINGSHNISGGAGSDDGLSFAWSHIIVTSLFPTAGSKGDKGDKGDAGANGTIWNAIDPFPVNAIVGHNQQMWIAINQNSNSEPSESNSDWEIYSGRVFIDTVDPVSTDGNNGDIWYVY